MALTESEWQTLIIAETGAEEFAEIESTYLPLWWSQFDTEEIEVQAAKSRVQILRYMQMKYRKKIDSTIGPDKYVYSQMFKNITAMLDEAKTQVSELTPFDDVPPLGTSQMEGGLPEIISETADKIAAGEYPLGTNLIGVK